MTASADEPVVVDDARADRRVSGLPPVTSGVVGSYLGVPLRSGSGETVGALCVFDAAPHDWREADAAVLEQLAASVVAELELAALSAEYEAERARWELAIDAAGIGSFGFDLRTGQLSWDDNILELFGLDWETPDLSTGRFLAQVHPDDLPALDATIREAIRVVGPYEAEFRVRLGSGRIRWVQGRGRVLDDGRGRASQLLWTGSSGSRIRSSARCSRSFSRRARGWRSSISRPSSNVITTVPTNASRRRRPRSRRDVRRAASPKSRPPCAPWRSGKFSHRKTAAGAFDSDGSAGKRRSEAACGRMRPIMLTPPPFEDSAFGEDDEFRFGRSGQFNQTHWRVNAGEDHTDLQAQLLTLHEWTHNELNNVSAYGCLLTVYAQLALHAKVDRDRHKQTLGGLVERSRRAHEVYATWYSTDMFLMRAGLFELLDEYPAEYVAYFEAGAGLVRGIDRPFLRQQAFLCAVRICFSGAALVNAGRDLAGFELSEVDETLYPTATLELLTRVLPAGFFETQLAAFYGSDESPAALSTIRDACAKERRDADFFAGVKTPEADAATMGLHRWFHERLADLLSAHGVESVRYGQHLEYFVELLPRLNLLCDDSVTHPLVASTRPYDNAANLLLHMENEELEIRPQPWPCVVRTLSEVPSEDWKKLAGGDPAHLFFYVRYGSQILAQHRFSEEDRKFLESRTDPLVVVRRKIRTGESIRCELFVFDTPAAVVDFRRLTHDVPAYSSISMAVMGNSDWCDQWLAAVTDDIVGTILFDESVFHTLKDGWPQHLNVRYCKGVLTEGGKRHVFLVFLGESKNGTYSLYLSPCSKLFMDALSVYIRQKLPADRFVYDETFMREMDWLIPPVVSHLLAEDRSFSFNHIRYV